MGSVTKRALASIITLTFGCLGSQALSAQPIGGVVKVGNESDAFWMDVTEVTVGQFQQFANETKLITAAESRGGGYEYRFGWQQRDGWTYLQPYGELAQANEPAVHISWFEAQQYCHQRSGRLPTRHEWVSAAYTETRPSPPAPFEAGKTYPYPTGDSGQLANTEGDADGWSVHAPVASFAAGVNGLYDMGANVWEWVDDARGEDRLTAGGSWWYGSSKMQVSGLQYKPADFFAVYVGFRCVYEQDPATK
jgi:formylglycine-generating enzyme